MQINSVSNVSYQPAGNSESGSKVKQLFDKLGSALESGNLSDAKDAMTELQKYAPPQTGNDDNPMKAKMEKLSQALDSGDVTSAKDAYADIKKTMAQRPASGQGRPAGQPPSGAGPSAAAGDSCSSSSNKVYDKKDLNQDGTVSAMEELLYDIEHSDQSTTTSADAATHTGGGKGILDVTA